MIIVIIKVSSSSSSSSSSTSSWSSSSSSTTRNPSYLLNVTINPILYTAEFSLSDLSIDQYVAILNSKNDFSSCMVNCSNNGMCKYGGNSTFICVCQADYGGKTCQQNLLPCSHSPCLNNATCFENTTDSGLNSSSSSYYCSCQENYYGQNCEKKVNICVNETCSGNGVCKDVGNLPVCQCFALYSGTYCEVVSSQQKTIKTVTSTASIIAIVTLALFYSLIVLSDVLNLFCLSSDNTKKTFRYRPQQLIYHP